ncbi:MAG: DUF3822 family protein [Paludibacteraceae bacterium]|nr:DUF3822 family protein [Paludibacteraceae bacterium]
MAHGRFVIVPDELVSPESMVNLIPAPLHLRKRMHVVKHEITDGLSIIFQATDEGDSPHEMEHLLSVSLSTAGISLHAEIIDDRLNIAVSDSDTLVFANSIHLDNIEEDDRTDVLYHILAVLDHLNLDTAKVPVTFSRDIDSNLRHLLSRYLCIK